MMMSQPCFQGAKETFYGRIVLTIARAAHTTLELIFGQPGDNPVVILRSANRKILVEPIRGPPDNCERYW